MTAIVRGDYEVNETKLGNAASAVGGIRPATVEEIRAAGMEPGYGSPIGAHDTTVVIDDLVARSPNLVAGANREGFHYRNVNAGRDFTADVTADITNAQEGDPCPTCGNGVILRNGIEVGNIFKLGTKFSDAFGATYLGEDGVAHPIVMGSYGIGVGRNVACIVEAHHDDKGIVWPAEVAPYARTPRDDRAPPRSRASPRSPSGCTTSRRPPGTRNEILWDDRDESPGVKFTDAELLGHALDPDGQPPIAGRRRHRGHGAGDRGALDPLDRGRGGLADRSALGVRVSSSGRSRASAARAASICASSSVVPSSAMTASPASGSASTSSADETPSPAIVSVMSSIRAIANEIPGGIDAAMEISEIR